MRFEKGRSKTGGRAPGTPNRATETIKDLALGLVQDPEYVASLKRRMVSGRSPQLEVLMHFYAYGKPKTEISTDKTIRVVIQRDPVMQGTEAPKVITVRPTIEQQPSEDLSSSYGGVSGSGLDAE
ncbi:MAG: hypothetical protein LZF60_360075 [Nitrospira sp.]|nr:MAG: hypothetical protein LZF60_360075 [Nitrospira sp.]